MSERVAARIASGWNARLCFCARRKMRIRLTGSRSKTSGVGDVDAVVVDDEIVGLGQRAAARAAGSCAIMRSSTGAGLACALLERGAEDRGEVADVLGDQEVVLHEALDVLQARMLGVAEPHRDLALDVERQPLLGAAGDEVHVAAHRPEEILAAAEQLDIRRGRTRRRSISSSASRTR